ncbi:MAG: hypothetical protein ACJAYU_000850 [Bradymonadia bacterium]|jgi:hypothetical protein
MRLLIAFVAAASFCLIACGTIETPSTAELEDAPDAAHSPDSDVPVLDVDAESGGDAITSDGGSDTPADSLDDALDDTPSDTVADAGGECLTNEQFFELRIWNEFAGTVCASCHRPGGLAGESRLLLIPESTEEALATNYEAFSALANDPVGSTLLLLKPINRHSVHHTGGEAIDADSQAYSDLVDFVLRATGELDECDPTAPVFDDCLDPWPGERLTRRLTREEYRRSVHALLGDDDGWGARLAPEPVVHGFDNNADALVANPLLVEQWLQAAGSLADPLSESQLRALGDCTAGEGGAVCATNVVERFGRRAFRRPLTDAEVARYEGLYAAAAALSGDQAGLRDIVVAMLISPNFLYRTELGEEHEGVYELTQHELGTALSFLVTGGPPDQLLAADADEGELTSVSLADHARRLIATADAEDSSLHFFNQWLELERLSTVSRDNGVYPAFSDEIRAAMTEELERYLVSTIATPGGTLTDLLTSTHSFANEELSAFYGWEGGTPDGEGWSRYDLADERVGILTQGGLLTTQALPTSGSPIHRGKLVRERFLCQPLPPPPPGISADPPALDPGLTTRERFALHSTDPICAGCHDLVDPIGFAFEQYDGVGVYRADENGLAIDTRGEIIGSRHTAAVFDGMNELATLLAESEDVHACYVQQWFRYSYGVAPEPFECSVKSILEEQLAGDADLESLVVALTQISSFYYRAADGVGPDEWSGRDEPGADTGSDVGVDAPDAGVDVPDAALDAEADLSADFGPDVPPVTSGLAVELSMTDDWGSGYCAAVRVTNEGAHAVTWVIELELDGVVNDFWNSMLTQDGGTATVSGADWNASIAPGASADFGFCANR